jgi:hypothetical protein
LVQAIFAIRYDINRTKRMIAQNGCQVLRQPYFILYNKRTPIPDLPNSILQCKHD